MSSDCNTCILPQCSDVEDRACVSADAAVPGDGRSAAVICSEEGRERALNGLGGLPHGLDLSSVLPIRC